MLNLFIVTLAVFFKTARETQKIADQNDSLTVHCIPVYVYVHTSEQLAK